ncbi:hypothetical protein GOB15_23795 [Sinorhizobium meliloti]|nr:hypothetical protein [Sinorhizobium meliloti]MDW9512856.1 hypothetical protein [Sinorhizobium meliloti]
MAKQRDLDLSLVKPDSPLRLAVAAGLAFPDGSMTASGLRREIGRGRLEIEVIAGKQYVTLAAINRMRERCRENPREHGSISERRALAAPPSGSFSTEQQSAALAAARMIAEGLKKPSSSTSPKSTSQIGSVATPQR